jgi:hypothetical protein
MEQPTNRINIHSEDNQDEESIKERAKQRKEGATNTDLKGEGEKRGVRNERSDFPLKERENHDKCKKKR